MKKKLGIVILEIFAIDCGAGGVKCQFEQC